MSHDLIIHVKNNAPVETIIELIKEGAEHTTFAINKVTHTDFIEIILTFASVRSTYNEYFIIKMLTDISEKYGIQKINLKNNKSYPYYINDDDIVFILNDNQWDTIDHKDYTTIETKNGKRVIVDDSELDDLELKKVLNTLDEIEDIEPTSTENEKYDLSTELYYSFTKSRKNYEAMKERECFIVFKWLLSPFDKSMEKDNFRAFEKAQSLLQKINI